MGFIEELEQQLENGDETESLAGMRAADVEDARIKTGR